MKKAEYIKINEERKKYNRENPADALPLFEPDYLDEIARLQPYSSIDENHLALLYLESDRDVDVVWVPVILPIAGGGGKASTRLNKLLIFINKKTGIVDEFSFREEFKVE